MKATLGGRRIRSEEVSKMMEGCWCGGFLDFLGSRVAETTSGGGVGLTGCAGAGAEGGGGG